MDRRKGSAIPSFAFFLPKYRMIINQPSAEERAADDGPCDYTGEYRPMIMSLAYSLWGGFPKEVRLGELVARARR